MTNTSRASIVNDLLSSLIVLVQQPRGSQEIDGEINALERMIEPLLPKLFGKDTVFQNLILVYRQVIQSGRVRLLQSLVAADRHTSKEILTLLDTEDVFHQLLPAAQPEMLIYLAQEHGALPIGLAGLMGEAVHRGDVSLFKAIATPYHPLEPFWSVDPVKASRVILACGPELAPELAQRLRQAFQANSQTCKDFDEYLYLLGELKAIAAMLCAGLKLNNARCFSTAPLLSEITALMALTSSAHGKMTLFQKESSLEDLLGRPAEGGSFYGLSFSKSHGLTLTSNKSAKT